MIRKIRSMYYSTVTSIYGMVLWAGTIWKWRWWDYGYSLSVIRRDLELKYMYFGVKTHYIGDDFTKKRIAVILRQLDKYDNANIADEKKELRKFLKMYAANLERMWD